MNNLKLRIDKYLDSDGGAPPEVFATIYPLDPESGRKRTKQKVRREMVPISKQPSDSRAIALDPGHYFVEVALPSGEILSDSVDVTSNQDAELVLNAEDSPHEWLSWQHLVGNVSSAESSTLGIRSKHDKALKSLRLTPVPQVEIPPSLNWLSSPMPGLVHTRGELSTGRGHDVWTALAKLPTSNRQLSQLLNSGKPPQPIGLYNRDPQRAIYRVIHGAQPVSGATTLNSDRTREFVAVPQRNSIELVSLPMPWPLISSGREAVIEIVVQQVCNASEFATSLTVRDDRLGVLLGFLSSGALGAVQQIAQTAQGMLYGKTMNSLAAAAGAYAMVGSATDSKEHEWHLWVRNLCNWFELMPDGAIQFAWLHLRLRRGPSDLDEARRWLKIAYRRGLPYFSLGVRWLLDGLDKVSHSDSEAEEMRNAVRDISWRIHPQSPFTIIRLGKV